MAITDNRTLIDNANAIGSWVDEIGGTMGVVSGTDNFIFGTGAIEAQSSKTTDGILWDFGSTQDFTDVTFYFWVNMIQAALLDLQANQGMTMRFCGPTITDFFEIDIGGGDTYFGGFKMFVVDASVAKTASDNTGGTPPAVNAVQFVGITVTTTANSPGSSANFFVDICWQLPAATPGILVAGRGVADAPWTLQDIIDAGDRTDLAKAWGMNERLTNGTVAGNAPIRFGSDDAVIDDFEDTNEVFGWESNFVVDGFYGFSGIAGSAQMDVTMGIKSGTGNAATGAQGFQIVTGGPRWFMDFTDTDIDTAGFYGCLFSGGEVLDLAVGGVDLATVVFVDCNKCHVSNANIVRASVVAANTADGVAFMDTDDLGDIVFSNFEFSDGHGIEILASGPATQSDTGNTFSGSFGGTPGSNLVASSGSNDAMIYNNSAAAKTFNGADGATTPSFRNGASATSTYANNVTITFTPLVTSSEVRAYNSSSGVEIDGVESSGTSFAASLPAGTNVDVVVLNQDPVTNIAYVPIRIESVQFAASQNFVIAQQRDRNYEAGL